jgi:hypothetical protein
LQLSIGSIAFRVKRTGASSVVTVSAYTGPGSPGPDAPGPTGTRQQPRSVDGLVLGLRGSGRSFHLVVFDGFMPPSPAENLRPSSKCGKALRHDCVVPLTHKSPKIKKAPADRRLKPQKSLFNHIKSQYLH